MKRSHLKVLKLNVQHFLKVKKEIEGIPGRCNE